MLAVLPTVLAVTTGAPAAGVGGGVRRNGRGRREASRASRGRCCGGVRIVGSDGVSVVGGRDGAGLCGRYESAIDELLLPVNDDLLAGLERGAVGEHGAGANGEVDLHLSDVGVEGLTGLAVATFAARASGALF